jgi:hypothetical protein
MRAYPDCFREACSSKEKFLQFRKKPIIPKDKTLYSYQMVKIRILLSHLPHIHFDWLNANL